MQPKAAGAAPPAPPAPPPDGLKIGSHLRYHDHDGWVRGVLTSLDPVILDLEDETEIRTTLDILHAGLASHLIERQEQ